MPTMSSRIGTRTLTEKEAALATYYTPRDHGDPRTGEELMRPHNLSCYGGAMAFYSNPTDLVRFGLSRVQKDPAYVQKDPAYAIDGELFGGNVMSFLTVPNRTIVVAVMSNISHADTSSIARNVADAFTK
jgi:hypothetical protein